jgi:hypothetical protein
MMEFWEGILKDLADDPAEYDRQGGTIIFVRHGEDVTLTLKEMPTIGIAVETHEPVSGKTVYCPIAHYIQQEILELPRLAAQVSKTVDKAARKRPAPYIECPSEYTPGNNTESWSDTSLNLQRVINEPEVGTTHLIQIMAGAGQGKTILLEEVAKRSASAYKPDAHPTPLLLTIDLLGRYVGTIDDAIAGALNNTYLFPGLAQKDITVCVRNRWIVLALDGFDELVARIGARDAFTRVTELLDQLKGSGTVILSARETFFELYQITTAIRSYLKPKLGVYSTSILKLLPWEIDQGIKVFSAIESKNPEDDLSSLLSAFLDDRALVLQPFFLTRLADLWMKGERFYDAKTNRDKLWRTRYIIEKFIARESGEKWTDSREQKPLLSEKEHTTLLAGIAEEMWRSGAFKLSVEELRIAGQLTLEGMALPSATVEAVLDRLPTHGALVTRERGYTSFLHDRFFSYYLGIQIVKYINEASTDLLKAVLGSRELSPTIAEWCVWLSISEENQWHAAICTLLHITDTKLDSTTMDNIARILSQLLNAYEVRNHIRGITFFGDTMAKCIISNQEFKDCQFVSIDFSGTTMRNCVLDTCIFTDLHIDNSTSFEGTQFIDCRIPMLDFSDHGIFFDPSAIEAKLGERGASFRTHQLPPRVGPPVPRVSEGAWKCVSRMVRFSEKTCDIALEDFEEMFEETSPIARIGIQKGILREVKKHASGPKKRFVRFKVDRQLLLRGQIEFTRDKAIDDFWSELAKKYPETKGSGSEN